MNGLKYGDITGKVIVCAMVVHNKMKSSYVEAVYQKCLAIEFNKAGINFLQEVDIPIHYDNIIVGRRRVDFMVEENVVVEVKAMSELTDQHLAQALNYLETHQLEVGLLINFGSKSLQFKRLINQHRVPAKNNPANPNHL